MPDHDPNGVDWQPAWKVYGYSSLEAYVEAKAGACPPEVEGGPDWPMPPHPGAGDEDDEAPDA